jgi:hypothetical protein
MEWTKPIDASLVAMEDTHEGNIDLVNTFGEYSFYILSHILILVDNTIHF